MRTFFRIFWVSLLFSLPSAVSAQEVSEAFRSTGYKLPRFVSLASGEVYVRSGPGRKYPVQWVFKKKGLPVEITLEYDAWRKIKDYDGQTGWVHQSLLSGRRTGFMHSEEQIPVYNKKSKSSMLQAYFQPKLLVFVEECEDAWCFVSASGYKGWVEQSLIWGVYEGENFD